MDGHNPISRASHIVALPALALALAAVVAACGNDDDDAATDAPAAPATTDAAADATPTAAGAASDTGDGTSDDGDVSDTLEALASETGSATVTIGDVTYEFSLSGTATVDGTTYVGRCTPIFGMIAASGFVGDGRDITIDAEIPPVDWETYEDDRFDPPAIEVEDSEANASWVADQEDTFVEGSGVTAFEQDGGRASGTAMFINAWDPGSGPVEGSFEIDCAG